MQMSHQWCTPLPTVVPFRVGIRGRTFVVCQRLERHLRCATCGGVVHPSPLSPATSAESRGGGHTPGATEGVACLQVTVAGGSLRSSSGRRSMRPASRDGTGAGSRLSGSGGDSNTWSPGTCPCRGDVPWPKTVDAGPVRGGEWDRGRRSRRRTLRAGGQNACLARSANRRYGGIIRGVGAAACAKICARAHRPGGGACLDASS